MKQVAQQTEYQRLRNLITPSLVFNQTLYESVLQECVGANTVWLDAGCGHKLLPAWRGESEVALINSAQFACGCDVDRAAIGGHRSLKRLVSCDLTALPFKDSSFTLITCNMVAEHLDDPVSVFREFARILIAGRGVVIVHTPYSWSYFSIVSRMIPQAIKDRIGSFMDGRPPADYYPVRYRCNTPRRLGRLFRAVGMEQSHVHMWASDAVLQSLAGSFLGRVPLRLELNLIKLSLRPAWRYLRVTLCGIFTKPVCST